VTAGVLGIVIIVVVAIFVAYLLTYGLRQRSIAKRQFHGLGRGDPSARAPGSAAEIADGGQVPVPELFAALRVAEVPELDAEGEPNDIAGLGLTLREGYTPYTQSGSARRAGEPQVIMGKRNGHQVFIRQGQIGETTGPGIWGRKLRHITTVRVDAPEFELNADDDGRLNPKPGAPGEVMGVIADLSPSPDVWHELRIVGGSKGIVASRGTSHDFLGGWIYDLWLLERLAAKLEAKPLPDIRLRWDWPPPYLGDWAPSALDALRGG
jgi:hypothetical protein